MYIYVLLGFQEVKERMILVASDDKLRNISWKVFFEGWILVLRARCLGVSKFFRIKRRWRRLKQFIVKRFRPESRARRVSWFGMFMALFHHTFHTFAVCVFNIYFSTYSKNPSATPMGDVPRRLNECQVVTSRQTYSISIKIHLTGERKAALQHASLDSVVLQSFGTRLAIEREDSRGTREAAGNSWRLDLMRCLHMVSSFKKDWIKPVWCCQR